ncbi:hypothetical protein [Bartonella sp. AC140YNZD]|uniref:hypothetical protein n=1 Tax=Bartonella sp. AC140YNZD TaxID=3243447 RepID=UPI0035CEE0C9
MSPRSVDPFLILDHVGEVAYRLALPPQFAGIHDVFHVSMLRQYVPDPSHVLDWADLHLQADVSYETVLVHILDVWDKDLRGKTLRLVKVLWRHHGSEEATW